MGSVIVFREFIIRSYTTMTIKPDTIAAIGTAPGDCGIAVIRVSGPESLAVADKIFKCSPPLPSERKAPAVIYGHIISEGIVIDESLLLVMRAPHSYTREDIVEFQCHGGNISAKRILRAILKEQVRIAEPGEFTKRAFLNGRIDLLQAEAVLDIIRARTDRSSMIALEQMAGHLSASFNDIYNMLLRSSADLEAWLDFMDGELPDEFIPAEILNLNNALKKINELLDTWDEGHILRDGALVVISGKPNVGKSTLLNAILGKNRVIVSPVPGTTRDVIEEQMSIAGIPVRLVDTAGLRSSECSLEQEGVRRAKNQIALADLSLYVIDASQETSSDDHANISSLKPSKTIIILNKTDLGCAISENSFQKYERVKTQAVNGKGIKDVKIKIGEKLGIAGNNLHQCAISERHRNILIESKSILDEVINILNSNNDEFVVVAASRLNVVLDKIGQATGKKFCKELLDSIFNRFCIGK